MMLLWSILQVATAMEPCVLDVQDSWDGEQYRGVATVTGREGVPLCRRLQVGSVLDWQLQDARVVLRQWDDTKRVFGVERLASEGGHWILHVPELRADDRLSIRLEGTRVRLSELWIGEAVQPQRQAQKIDMEWTVDGAPLFGPDGTVSRTVRVERLEEAQPGVHRQWWPLGGVDHQCEVWVDEVKVAADINDVGCAVRISGGESLKWRLVWTDPAVSSSDEWTLGGKDTIRVRGAQFASTGLEPVANEEGLQFVGPGRLGIRIHEIAGTLIENNAIEEVQYAAKAVSLPEPGIGIEFKGYRGDESVIPVVLAKVRSQMVSGTLPGHHPLKPRKLIAARKSGWGTPWEQALILSRYLEQLKISATPFAVRPALMGTTVEGAPLGYTGAVVRVSTDDGDLWLDPSCSVCGVGEVHPSLWGGTVFDAGLATMPPQPVGEMSIQQVDDGVEVHLRGPPALELRRWLTQFPVDGRSVALAERFGGPGATLHSHDGLVDLGQPITLQIKSQSRR